MQPNGKMNILDNATQHKWIDCQTSDEDFIFLRFLFIQDRSRLKTHIAAQCIATSIHKMAVLSIRKEWMELM